MTAIEPLLDAQTVQKLEAITLAAHLTVQSSRSGNRKSHQKGSSVEFSDFREYVPGDDFRRVDWNAYARFERMYIKLFMEERELPVTLYLDASASMDSPTKGRRALQLAAVMCYLAQRNLDRITLVLCNATPRRFRVPSGRPGLWQAVSLLESFELSGTTTLQRDIQENPPPLGGLSVVISDFLAPDVQESLKFLLFRRQQVALLHTLAEDELRPQLSGSLRLLDRETEQERQIHVTPVLMKRYQDTLSRFIDTYRQFAHRYGLHYLMVDTALPLDEIVFKGFFGAGIVGG